MISRFFIDRPVFANVIAIMTILFGIVAIYRLPVERYPAITPPTVVVSTVYPGANARVVADTVAAPIEQEINGVENMMYMSSTSSADGAYSLTITFEIGTNLDDAQVLVQNRLNVAEPKLPEEVRRQGLTVKKQTASIILAISLTSPTKQYDDLFLSNYATLHVRDELSRVNGVGEVLIRGAGAYSMRVWLDPDKLASRRLTTQDVVAALARQNVQVAAGQLGQPPHPGGEPFQLTITTQGRLSEPVEFENIILKSGMAGQIVYLRDVATVELGGQTYDSFTTRSGMDSANLLIFQLPGSNAVEVAKNVRAAVDKLRPKLPEGMDVSIPFDTTKFVEAAINEVYMTLIEAGILVLIVILIFLQSWRALLVPATTVPVTIIGAFAFMPFFGFSINLLTLFGLVLAIGIVVDDAIVIVENAMHHIERGKSTKDATIAAMGEVTGPIISITLVLMAVFLPTAFIPGVSGQMYRQFALTIAATALISALNALTLKPAQCAQYLRAANPRKNFLSRAFNASYGWVERRYTWMVGIIVRVWGLVLIVFLFIALGAGVLYEMTPKGFLPDEDQGWVLIAVQLPDGASLDRTRLVMDKMNEVFERFRKRGVVENYFILGGQSLLDGTNSPNAATAFAAWTDWSQRTKPEDQQDALVGQLFMEFGAIQEAFIIVIKPPAIMGLGFAGGFQMQIQDREGLGLEALQERTQAIMQEAAGRPEVVGNQLMSTFRAGVPQIYLNIDTVKAEKMGVPVNAIHSTLQANLGSVYVNDFNKFDRTYQVRVQAHGGFRGDINSIRRLEVRNRDGDHVPLGTLLTVESRVGPQSVQRYNLYPTAAINGRTTPGFSSGDSIKAMEQTADQVLPASMGYEWTNLAFQEKRVSGQAIFVYVLAVFLVYLVLAAQYESWLLPFAVILVVPLGLLGVVSAVLLRGMENNIYTQIGVVLIIALASKNAILIVEFARELRASGQSVRDAAVNASRMRFRPIIMTSFAFILGVLPLVFATGAGAASRQSLGTAVCGGMVTATFLAVFFVPAFYVAIQYLIEMLNGPPKVIEGAPHLSLNGDAHHDHGSTPNGKPLEPDGISPSSVKPGT